MEPHEYFPRHYRNDVHLFAETDVPPHGPFGLLCGWTLERLFAPGQPEKYADPEGFLCMLWLLNLAHQGMYTYFFNAYRRWLEFCEPFPDLRACPSHHGGLFTPGHLLRYALVYRSMPGAITLELHEKRVHAFFNFFFNQYLGTLSQQGPYRTLRFSPMDLLAKLRADPDCAEVSRFEKPVEEKERSKLSFEEWAEELVLNYLINKRRGIYRC